MVVYKYNFTALPIHVLLCASKFSPYIIMFKIKYSAMWRAMLSATAVSSDQLVSFVPPSLKNKEIPPHFL